MLSLALALVLALGGSWPKLQSLALALTPGPRSSAGAAICSSVMHLRIRTARVLQCRLEAGQHNLNTKSNPIAGVTEHVKQLVVVVQPQPTMSFTKRLT